MSHIDWDCKVKTLFRDKNLGCKYAVSSAIAWFFEQVEEGIILEDDCLADPTFFSFCQELLEKYRHDERVMMISGDNFQFGKNKTPYGYYFSRYTHIWGWATWRRAWKYYDVRMSLWPETRDSNFLARILSPQEASYWNQVFERTYRNEIETWDYQWTLACWIQSGLTIIPSVNLVRNIGAAQGTHTTKFDTSPLPPLEIMTFPLLHPPGVWRHGQADDSTFSNSFHISRWDKLKRLFVFLLNRKQANKCTLKKYYAI